MRSCFDTYRATRFALDGVNLHVAILKPPRGKRKTSTWARNKTSEESNETSEEMILVYVEIFLFLRGDFRFSTEALRSVVSF